MQAQIDRIQHKLADLRKLDPEFKLFGATLHHYKFNPVKTEDELSGFEKDHGITLPPGYRAFLKQIGNGGAGPYHGLETLERGRFYDLENTQSGDIIDLSKPFLITEAWNFDWETIEEEAGKEELEKIEEAYFELKWANGLLRISDFGWGASVNLVVNGKEHGTIWLDDRNNDKGIYPDPYYAKEERINFLDWYEAWLDKSIIDAQKT